MLQITNKHRIFLVVQAIDFRKGLNSLVALCSQQLQFDPMSGHFFMFRNRKATSIKVLAYDSQGFWLCQKRLSAGAFKGWPKSAYTVVSLNAPQLNILLNNGDPAIMNYEEWQSIDD